MLNVLTLSTLYPNRAQPNFGGFVERQTVRLASRSDVRLKVIAPIGNFILPVGPYAALRDVPLHETRGGVDIVYPRFPLIPAIGWRLNPGFVERVATRMLDVLETDGFTPDVIDCEFFWPDGPAAVALGNALGIPVSIKARGSDIKFWGERSAARRSMLDAAARADGLLAVSAAMKADMVALGMPGDRIRIHYTGIELDRFRPVDDRVQAKRMFGVSGPLLVSVGNLVSLKRHHLAIEAAARLPSVTLLIAGEGRQRPKLEELIARLGVGSHVRLLGDVGHHEMPALMAAADVCVHASSNEGLANAWIEALACGTPVVSTRVGGAAEVIDRPEAGRLVDDPNPASIADAVSELIANPPSREAVRAAARRFDWDENTNSLHAHLSGLKRQQ